MTVLVGVATLAWGLAVWLLIPPAGAARLRAAPRAPDAGRSRWDVWAAEVRARLPESRAERRRREALMASVPVVCGLLAVCVEAGAPARSAVAVVAATVAEPVATELHGVGQRIALGIDEPAAWAALAAVPGYRAVARDLAQAVARGTGVAELLRRHAREARRDAVGAAQARARTAGVYSVIPLMLCFLPAFLLLGVVPVLAAILGSALG
ncbi:type II secretion system F family protein [Propioniciclava soli]|uniref:Type II secretion system F family protein n=1 Tax=Propioniciclava soli TaxID=2775081 RepID=A0ABZ3C933_9ACTN|nr:type II secretion system F family protein [Propioniciclava soli]